MSLDKLEISNIRDRFSTVWKETEQGVLKDQRQIALDLKDEVCTLDIKQWRSDAIAFVAADGGDNRLRLDSMAGSAPATVELVRVVSSDNKVRIMEIFAGETEKEIVSESPPVNNLREVLGCKRISQLSRYLDDKILGDTPKSRSAQMKEYREIVEWAVLYDLLATQKRECDTLLVREGALRTRTFPKEIFNRLNNEIQSAHKRHQENGINIYYVGVSKQTKLLNRLRFALSLENVFNQNAAQYVRVPKEITQKFYDRRWLDTAETTEGGEYNSLADMYLVKFGDHPLDPVWPVDIPKWQQDDAEKILGLLAQNARIGFPIPDFPMCIQQAHEHAKIGGIEMAYLNELLFEEVEKNMSKEDCEKLLRARYLAQDVTALRYPNEQN